jgi:large subunit ribosomal protein L25
LRYSAQRKLTVEVPVHFLNEDDSPGLKTGGVINVVRHAIEVSCVADSIPESFEIDLAGLEIGDSIHASALILSEGVELTITDRDFTIATIAAPTVMAVEEEVESEEGIEGEEDSETQAAEDADSGDDNAEGGE